MMCYPLHYFKCNLPGNLVYCVFLFSTRREMQESHLHVCGSSKNANLGAFQWWNHQLMYGQSVIRCIDPSAISAPNLCVWSNLYDISNFVSGEQCERLTVVSSYGENQRICSSFKLNVELICSNELEFKVINIVVMPNLFYKQKCCLNIPLWKIWKVKLLVVCIIFTFIVGCFLAISPITLGN